MKTKIIVWMMLLTIGTAQSIMAQSHHKMQQQELVDSTSQADALESFSDTTDTTWADNDTLSATTVSRHHRLGGWSNGGETFHNIFDEFILGQEMGFVLLVLLILFVLAPVSILAVILFFVYKNRKQNRKLAQEAMQNGQQIPDQLLTDHRETDDEVWRKGIRQTFLGLGLLAFFIHVDSNMGVGIGILVTAIGLGKLVIVKTKK
jgi:hypothetical protein